MSRLITVLGPWEMGNAGGVGRIVTTWLETPLGVMPVVDWEDKP